MVQAHNTPPNKGGEPTDKEADWTVKRGQPHYGYKLHIGVDEDSGIIRKAVMTPASTHDSRVFDPLLSGDEGAVYADKAYDDKGRMEHLKTRGIMPGILKSARRNTPLIPNGSAPGTAI